MTSLLQTLDYYHSRYWIEHGDPRANKSTLLAGGPWQMLTITMTYLTAVTLFGPYMMRKRKPMENIIWPIRAYNAFMVFFNAYLFFAFSLKLNWGLDCWGCGKSMQRLDQAGMVLCELMLLSRYFDFFDSIFFVCRKKFNHLSVLHVTHHTLVPIIVWFAIKLIPTPMIVFAGYINLPIHVIMYTYYGLSTFPQAIFSITFMYLFGQFYLRSYMNKDKDKDKNKGEGKGKDNTNSSRPNGQAQHSTRDFGSDNAKSLNNCQLGTTTSNGLGGHLKIN